MLPKPLRIGSLVSIFIYLFFISIIIDTAGLAALYPAGFIRSSGIWLIAAFLGTGLIPNAISRSRKERYTMTPLIIVLLALVAVVGSGR